MPFSCARKSKEAFSKIREIAFQPSSFLVGGWRMKGELGRTSACTVEVQLGEAVKGQARSLEGGRHNGSKITSP